jgi:hypothetical protein
LVYTPADSAVLVQTEDLSLQLILQVPWRFFFLQQ